MNNIYSSNIFRFLFLLLLQGLVFENIDFENIDIFVYPMFALMLPLNLPHGIVVALAFLMGISVDFFYNGFGLHAACLVIIAFARPLVLALMEPRGGFEVGQTLTKRSLGIRWFLRYSALMTFAHVVLLTTLENLAISWMWLAKIFITFVLSWLLIILYQYIFNPKH
jgi:hypothetical protein